MKRLIIGLILMMVSMSCTVIPGYYFDPMYDNIYTSTYDTRYEYKLNYAVIPNHFNLLNYNRMFNFSTNFGRLTMNDIYIDNGRVYTKFTLDNINYTIDKFSFETSSEIIFDGRYLYLSNINVEYLNVSKYIDKYTLNNVLRSNLENYIIGDIYSNGLVPNYMFNRIDNIFVKGNNLVAILK